jgi:hypothetical protein
MTNPLRVQSPEARLLALFARLGEAPDAIPPKFDSKTAK